jgi:hypothetical protein
MKTLLAISIAFAAAAAQAHESLLPHAHPHGLSMLPDIGTLLVGGIFALAAALAAYTAFGRR